MLALTFEQTQTTPIRTLLFRGSDQLGAVNLRKRVWHKAYLEKLSDFHRQLANLTRARVSFDSVSAVAAAAWVARLLERLREESVWQDFTGLTQTLYRARADLREISIPDPIASATRMEESRWLDCIDAEVFQSSFWDGLQPETRSKPTVAAARLADAFSWHGSKEENPQRDKIVNRRSALMGEKGFGLGVCGVWEFFPGGATA